jgi:hypothetical protein
VLDPYHIEIFPRSHSQFFPAEIPPAFPALAAVTVKNGF